MPLSDREVRGVYLSLLGREPEAAGLAAFRLCPDVSNVVTAIRASPEAGRSLVNASPFKHFYSLFDAWDIVESYADPQVRPVTDRLVNFLGVIIDPAFYPPALAGRAGQVEPLPFPANWHADVSEFAAVLRAVQLSGERFTVVELGCGWGCWLLNAGVAARRRGKTVRLLGVEADEGHIGFARRACLENGFSEGEFSITRRVVGARSGTALFPRQASAGGDWGLEAIFDPDAEQLEAAKATGDYDVVQVATVSDLTGPGEVIDLLHIDIQGAELGFIRGCLEQLAERVRFMVIGTHSREIEGALFATLGQDGWILEVERPAVLSPSGEGPVVVVDGVQGWRNTRR